MTTCIPKVGYVSVNFDSLNIVKKVVEEVQSAGQYNYLQKIKYTI